MARCQVVRLVSLVVVFVVLVDSAIAWGKEGHEMVANLAYDRLSNATQEAVKNILGCSSGSTLGEEQDSPLGAVANWADRVRFTKKYHWSIPLHYIDVQDKTISGGCPCEEPGETSKTCTFEYDRDCAGDRCVAGAIVNYTSRLQVHSNRIIATLKNLRASSREEKWLLRESLMFLTHFVGDIHQPLHSSRASDKGGNTIHVHFDQKLHNDPVQRDGSHSSHDWNLHAVWDEGMIQRALLEIYGNSREQFQADLKDVILDAEKSGLIDDWLTCADGRNVTCISMWAEQSLEAALAWAYRNVDGSNIENGSELTTEYYETRLPVVMERLAVAAVRLARCLEILLGCDLDSLILIE